jgi:DNA-binding CsgD family transcriptional regulator
LSVVHPLGHARQVNALGEIGLSTQEERVYLAVLDAGRCDSEQLARTCGLAKAATDRALRGLQVLGLVTRAADAPGGYVAVPPDLAIGVLIRQHEARLALTRQTLRELTERFQAGTRAGTSEDLLEVVHEPQAIHQRWLQLQRSARKEIRALDKPPYIDPGNSAEPDLLVDGVGYRTVYDRAALEHPGKLDSMWEASAAGENSRIAAGVPIKLFIADDRMALAPLRAPQDVASAVIVHPSALLDALSALFESVWHRALPLAALDEVPDLAGRLSRQQRRLLQLLASGCTDQAIARHLQVGYRTVQRQISALMEQFEVDTRFQLGLETARLLPSD